VSALGVTCGQPVCQFWASYVRCFVIDLYSDTCATEMTSSVTFDLLLLLLFIRQHHIHAQKVQCKHEKNLRHIKHTIGR